LCRNTVASHFGDLRIGKRESLGGNFWAGQAVWLPAIKSFVPGRWAGGGEPFALLLVGVDSREGARRGLLVLRKAETVEQERHRISSAHLGYASIVLNSSPLLALLPGAVGFPQFRSFLTVICVGLHVLASFFLLGSRVMTSPPLRSWSR